MTRNKILIGLTTVVAAGAFAAPAAMAQEVIPPAQPSQPVVTPTPTPTPMPTPEIISPAQPAQPTNLQPQGAAVHIDNCKVARSPHGYLYAVCPVVAQNVAYNSSVSVIYTSRLKTIKPRTSGSWAGQTGTYTLSSTGTPGLQPGQTTEVVGRLKFAFKDRNLAKVKKGLIVSIEIGKGGYITGPIAAATGR
jgi:hypothetical protein